MFIIQSSKNMLLFLNFLNPFLGNIDGFSSWNQTQPLYCATSFSPFVIPVVGKCTRMQEPQLTIVVLQSSER